MTSRRGSTPALALAYALGFLAFRQLVLFALGPELSPAVLGLVLAVGSCLATHAIVAVAALLALVFDRTRHKSQAEISS